MTTSGGIVIVGGGLAAARTAEQLRRSEYTGPITIVSDEDHLPYDRPPLSKEVLRAETDDVTLKLINPLRPGLLTEGDTFWYLIMPIRLAG